MTEVSCDTSITTSIDSSVYSKDLGHPNFRNWALQPVPTMQVGAAALGYPDSLKVTKRHEVPPTVIANEFTAAGVTQDCADDLARIINDAFAGMWDQRKEYYGPSEFPTFAVIMIAIVTIVFTVAPLLPLIFFGIPYLLCMWLVTMPVLSVFWCGIHTGSAKTRGPKFEFGTKALENAQPALRECLARHGVNGTVRPAREMEGISTETLCTESIARFWVRLEVTTPQTNAQIVQLYTAGLPIVHQFYNDMFSQSAIIAYESGMSIMRQLIPSINATSDLLAVQQMVQMAMMQQIQMRGQIEQMAQMDTPMPEQISISPISIPFTTTGSLPAPVPSPAYAPAPAPAPVPVPAPALAPAPAPALAPAPSFTYAPPAFSHLNADNDTTTWL